MINIRPCGKEFCVQRMLSILALLVSFSTAARGADGITGAVRNQTNGQPSVADEVILIGLDGGMREEVRAQTDARGAFALPVQHPDKPYLLRVIHQNVNYDQKAYAGDALSIPVFDAAAHVRGVTGSIEILRTGTNGKLLHVSDMYEIKNESNPPLTQAGEHTFEVYLPASAKINSVLAAGPRNVAEVIFASPVPGDPGHYTVSFPLRPGATKFVFDYGLPYAGRATFRTRLKYPLQQLAVMMPPTMKFSSRSLVFETLATGANYHVQVANQLKEGEGPGFEVSGTGALPPLGDQGKSQARPQSTAVASPKASGPGRALLGTSGRIDSRMEHAQAQPQWLVLDGLIAVLVAACALLVWRMRTPRGVSGTRTGVPLASQNRQAGSFSELRKKGLLRFETNWLRRSISAEDCSSTQQALERPAKYAARSPSLRRRDG
jgi:hypothetical protein